MRAGKRGRAGGLETGGNLPLRQHCESAHLAGAVQLRLQTLRRRQGMKRGGKTSAESPRVVAGHHGCRARQRKRDRREREKEERGLDAEISVTCSLCEDFNAAGNRIKDKVCGYFDRCDRRCIYNIFIQHIYGGANRFARIYSHISHLTLNLIRWYIAFEAKQT